MSLSIIVLAAGKGSRMQTSKPKVFHEVGNYPMLFHILDTSSKLKNSAINIVINNFLKDYRNVIREKYNNVSFSIQKKQNGTADAVQSAFKAGAEKNSQITLVLCGDTPLISVKTIKDCLKKFEKNSLDLCVISMEPENKINSYGKLKFKKNQLVGIIEESEIKNQESRNIKYDLCNSGIILFKTKSLLENLNNVRNTNKKKEFYLTDLVDIFYKKKLLIDHFTCEYRETLGVNSLNDLAKVNKEFQKNRRNYFLSKGVVMEEPESVFFSYDTVIGKNVEIEPNVYFGKSVNLRDKVLVRSFSYLDNVKVYENVTIGPFARIRDGVEIKDHSKIGNFVEIKKSRVDKNVKISHLSYIGDSTINSNSNIGAGAITCNFDGARKNKTTIGKNCFIGSNTSLVAPLNIKQGSVIGAGTVVNKDIPNETVVYRKSELIKKNKKK